MIRFRRVDDAIAGTILEAMGRPCPMCHAARGELCGPDEGVCEERLVPKNDAPDEAGSSQVRDVETLIGQLRGRRERLIGVDGWSGAGKSTIGQAIASATGWQHIDLDALLLRKNAGAFVEHLDLRTLRMMIKGSERRVVSGICLRQALNLAGVSEPNVLVYVRDTHLGVWFHGPFADGTTEGGFRLDSACPPGPIELEIRRYHRLWRPHLTSEYEFVRDTGPSWALDLAG